jgi:hypothetical protein
MHGKENSRKKRIIFLVFKKNIGTNLHQKFKFKIGAFSFGSLNEK